MKNTGAFSLRAHEVGAVPIVRYFFDRLGLDQLLDTYVPETRLGRPSKLPHSRAVSVMVMNAILCREPLYGVPQWLARHALEPFGVDAVDIELFNDDRIGRALDRVYETDPASLLTAVAAKAVQEFDLSLDQIHNDTTTVTFSGAYEGQKDKAALKRAPLITFGHNKDHRPDLKQLLVSLTITADGAVPIHFKTYDGNVTDEKTHRETWSAMRKLIGHSGFVYVADSKLCTRENMAFIASQGGSFVTVLPRTRKEDEDFRTFLQHEAVAWEEVRRERREVDPDDLEEAEIERRYEAFESPQRSSEGYRVIWYRSSVKIEIDQRRRTKSIARARQRIRELQERTGAHRFRTVERAREAADRVLRDEGAERWLTVAITEQAVGDMQQVSRGRPGKDTIYRKVEIPVILFAVSDNADAIKADAICDGIFGMVTNKEDVSPKQVLDIYKYQPFLEKRHEQLKSVLSVAPVFLKKPERVAALLVVYYLAVLVFALIERELRRQMKTMGIPSLPLYPEGRPAKAPTTALILQTMEGHRRSTLVDQKGNTVQVFHDPLEPVAVELLNLLGVDLASYGVTKER